MKFCENEFGKPGLIVILILFLVFSSILQPGRINGAENKLLLAADQQSANTARDGELAIREEYDALLAKNTKAAIELFIARHSDHALAQEAAEYIRIHFKDINQIEE